MKGTQYYALRKPEPADRFLASDIGANLDAIDEAIRNAAESGTASVDGMDIKPASVTATGSITGASVGDANGTLADLRSSVSQSEWADASAGVYASKIGHIVILTLRTRGRHEVTLTPQKNSLTTLPSGWRPSGSFVSTATAGNDVYQLLADPSGEVYILSNYQDTRSGYLRGNLVFCVA